MATISIKSAISRSQLSTTGDTLALKASTAVYTGPSANVDLLRYFVVALVSTLLLTGCGTSAEDKAKIRLAVSAVRRAVDANEMSKGAMEERLAEAERAIDAVPDGEARTAIVDCERLLWHYKMARSVVWIATRANLYNMSAEAAYAAAERKHPVPDYEPIAACLARLDLLAP
jgi:hypothetical protein